MVLIPISIKAQSTPISDLNKFMDNWHAAATVADAEAFFNKMSADAIYIGTDAKERWLRDELRTWSESAFERDTAWHFVATERNWHQAGNTWVCDELLRTWMGPCRSTAVILKENGLWQIKHYQLSVCLPNEKVEAFKQLVETD